MKSKSPLKSTKLLAASLAVVKGFLAMTLASTLLAHDVGLTGKSNINLLAFDSAVRPDTSQERTSLIRDGNPLEGRREGESAYAAAVDSSETVMALEGVERSAVNRRNGDGQLVGGVHVRAMRLFLSDLNATLTIEQASKISVGYDHLGSEQMLANSGDTPCPARNGAEGQSRTKHRISISEGVRNDKVPTAKAKVLSELGGNAERSAEMTGLHGNSREITDCYNRSLLQTVRYVDPLKKGDLSFGGLYYQDMPLYWDRQCPSGRLYFLNSKYTYITTDPMMMFRWTEPRTWPNQVVDVRLLLLRLAQITTSRMFLTVLDGWTA